MGTGMVESNLRAWVWKAIASSDTMAELCKGKTVDDGCKDYKYTTVENG